jgi:hypothetical protein
MRFKIKATLVAVLSVCALSGVAVASASAHELHSTKEGTLKGVGDGEQYITTPYGFTCDGATVTGKVKAGYFTSFDETIDYEKCGYYGYKVTPVEFELNANGTVKLLNTVKIENKSAKCYFTITPAGNEKLTTTEYVSNKAGTILQENNLFKVKATSFSESGKPGSVCGENDEQQTLAFEGNLTLEVVGGLLSWA